MSERDEEGIHDHEDTSEEEGEEAEANEPSAGEEARPNAKAGSKVCGSEG